MAHITLYWRGTTGRVGGGAEGEVLLQARTKSHHAGGTNNMCWGLPFGTMKEQQKQLGCAAALPSSTPDAAAAPPQTVPGLASLRIAAREVDVRFSPTGPTTDRTLNRLFLDASREKSCHIWASLRAVVAARWNASNAVASFSSQCLPLRHGAGPQGRALVSQPARREPCCQATSRRGRR